MTIFHAFTGADNIGKFSGVSKTKWFQQHMKADISLPRALLKLYQWTVIIITEEVKEELAKFVCLKYCPKGVSITDLRWHLFCKQLTGNNKLPPTLGAFEEHVHQSCMCNCKIENYGDKPTAAF